MILAHRLHTLYSSTSSSASDENCSPISDEARPAALPSNSLHGIRILELGAGAAIAAIVCARLGARVTAQELTEQRVAHARACAAMNSARVRVCQGRWATDSLHSELFGIDDGDDLVTPQASSLASGDATSTLTAQLPSARRFDMVVMADVLYGDTTEFDDLLATILAAVRPGGAVFVSVEQRRRDIAPFFARVAAHFSEARVLRYDISRLPGEADAGTVSTDADSDVPTGGVVYLLECRGARIAANEC